MNPVEARRQAEEGFRHVDQMFGHRRRAIPEYEVDEAQAVAVSGFASGHSDTAIAGKVLRVVKRRVRANKRRVSRR